jgi:hypothetical protein
MKINVSQLTIENDKREIKRYVSLHAFMTALTLVFGVFYDKLDRRLDHE